VGRALLHGWLAYIDWRLRRMAIRLLRRMSDRQLEDLGLSRSQIVLATRGGAGQHPMLHPRIS
jgi:uncharacterized protein YjiS (DUF1127 family)